MGRGLNRIFTPRAAVMTRGWRPKSMDGCEASDPTAVSSPTAPLVPRVLGRRRDNHMNVIRDRRQAEGGQALIMFVMGIVAFVGFVALTIDVGMIFEGRRGEQNAADAAALAGASALPGDAATAKQLSRD